MRGLYLYAIADSALPRPPRGMFGGTLRSIDVGGVYAVVERAARPPRATMARLRAQDRVLRDIARAGTTILPARFGAFSASRPELQAALAGRIARLKRALRRARGCVQMTVRLFPAGTPKARPRTSGAAYLRHLASASRSRASHPDMRRLRSALRALVRAERVEWHDGPRLVASVYHLVPRAREQEYLAAVAKLAKTGGLELVVSGPWLPFAFAEDEA